MKNQSFYNEPVLLEEGAVYIVIDALYLDDIKETYTKLGSQATIAEIKEKAFPYTAIPFAKYCPSRAILKTNNVVNIRLNGEEEMDDSYLASDTGLILFIKESILFNFLQNYSYNDLVESLNGITNNNYWQKITEKYKFTDIAVMDIPDPSDDTKTMYYGGGTFRIESI